MDLDSEFPVATAVKKMPVLLSYVKILLEIKLTLQSNKEICG